MPDGMLQNFWTLILNVYAAKTQALQQAWAPTLEIFKSQTGLSQTRPPNKRSRLSASLDQSQV